MSRSGDMIAVGKPLIEGKTNYQEGVIFEYTEAGPILIVAFNRPAEKEIEGVKSGKLQIGFYEIEPVVFITVKIQGCGGWMDTPFTIRKYDGKHTFDWSDPIGESQGLALTIVLIDATTGIVQAQRMIGTAHNFAVGLRSAILRQLEKPYDSVAFNQKVNEIYRNYTSDDIATRASCVFTIKR